MPIKHAGEFRPETVFPRPSCNATVVLELMVYEDIGVNWWDGGDDREIV